MTAHKWMNIAWDELGTKEIAGDKDDPRIIDYHATTSLKAGDDEVAWCSSFVNWVMKQAGIEGSNSAAARSWLGWGLKLSQPRYGAIVVFKRGSSAWQGHVAFYLDSDETHITVLGGNQSNRVCVAKYPKRDLLQYRWAA